MQRCRSCLLSGRKRAIAVADSRSNVNVLVYIRRAMSTFTPTLRRGMLLAALFLLALLVVPALPAGAASQDNNVFWNELGHNSRDPLYRSPGGAVPTGTAVTLRLRAANNDLTAAKVRIWDDRERPAEHPAHDPRGFRRDVSRRRGGLRVLGGDAASSGRPDHLLLSFHC